VKMECSVSLRTNVTAAAATATGILVNEVIQTGKRAFIVPHLQSLQVILHFTSIITHPLPDLMSSVPS
jgi:hypothetical protein